MPNEYLIQQARIPTIVGVGENDKYVDKCYLDFLKSLCANSVLDHQFYYLPGCQHNVDATDQGVDRYLGLVFGQ